jgi:16S rRNA (cytidine1402-2'-O)-methyltransferase
MPAMSFDASLVLSAAASAAESQQYPRPALYVVATPIGNLADITLRALHTLALADVVACEDTRTAGSLLRHFGLHKTLLSAHEHNEREVADEIVRRLAAGERVALISDAGTPAVSDPGAALVAAARAAGHRCVPLPGASSAVAAMCVAGDTMAAGFTVVGFLPSRGTLRDDAMQAVCAATRAQVLFEAPHRIEALALELARRCPERLVTLCRELTKQFETVETMPATHLPTWLGADPNRSRGEFVVVLHGRAVEAAQRSNDELERVLEPLLAELTLKRAVAVAAEVTRAPRNALYERALALQRRRDT